MDSFSRSGDSAFESWQHRHEGHVICESDSENREPITSPLIALTSNVEATFSRSNPSIRLGHSVPRRLLTQPGEAAFNEGHDNSEANLLVRVYDEIVPEKSHSASPVKYVVEDLLGQGTFGQVFLCQQVRGGERIQPNVAVKVVKSKPAYTSQAWLEVRVARLLNDEHGTFFFCPLVVLFVLSDFFLRP